tara:strand:+ start:1563 stop:1814 length:252 start_codon:yes stop_codon:yes gene_type:complete
MTDKQIEQLALRVSQLVIDGLEGKQKEWDADFIQQIDEEQSLLTDLAQAMTALDYNLKQENYPRCTELQATINEIETKLNKFK